jgi:hypothetical protein
MTVINIDTYNKIKEKYDNVSLNQFNQIGKM